jgi:hypothetical protein
MKMYIPGMFRIVQAFLAKFVALGARLGIFQVHLVLDYS